MKKLKVLIASMFGAIALIFACVVGTRVNAADASIIMSGASYSTLTKNGDPSVDSNFVMKITGGSGAIKTISYDSTSMTLYVTKTFTIKATLDATVTFDMTASGSKAVSDGKTLTITSDLDGTLNHVMTSADGSMQQYVYDFAKNETLTVTTETYVAIKQISYVEKQSSGDEAKTFKLNYHANGGSFTTDPSTSYTETEQEKGTLESYAFDLTSTVPTKTGYNFIGWSDTLNGTVKYVYDSQNATKITVTGTTTLYAVWERNLTPIVSSFSYSFVQSENSSASANGNGAELMVEGAAGLHDTGLKFKGATLYFNLSKKTKVVLTLTEYNLNKCVLTIDGSTEVDATSSTTCVLTLGEGNHSIYCEKDCRLAKFEVKQVSEFVTATLYKQFDDDSTKNMLRLMGKIEGIAYSEYDLISNVLMEFDFNGSPKSAYCYGLYKSIATLDNSLGASSDGKTMYVVLTITGLEKYESKSFTNVKMTITFSDGSTKEATHASF